MMKNKQLITVIAGLLLPLLPISIILLYDSFSLTIHRVTLEIKASKLVSYEQALIIELLGFSSILLLLLARDKLSEYGEVLSRCSYTSLLIIELLAITALLLSMPLGGPEPGYKLFNIILLERGLWICLAVLLPVLLPLSACLYYLRHFFNKEFLARHAYKAGRVVVAQDYLFLVASILIAVLSIFLPHTAILNPSGSIVSTDTYFHTKWLEILGEKGFLKGVLELSGTLRPLYLGFLYSLYKLLGLQPEVLVDIYLPLLGLVILSLTTYYVVSRSNSGSPGIISLLAILYWAPIFVYGGFQTNLFSLSLALLYMYSAWRQQWRKTAVVGAILGLWHPWTLAYYSIAVLVFLVLRHRDRLGEKILLSLVIPWFTTILVNTSLLESGASIVTGIISPVHPGFNPFFMLYSYVWGTIARPEILLPAACLLVLNRDSREAWFVAPAFLASFFLSAPTGFRVLMQAPTPLLLSSLPRKWLLLILVIASASWLYFILSSTHL